MTAPRYPTFLALTGDVILANRDKEDETGLIRVLSFDSRGRSVEGHLVSPCSDEERDGWFTIRHVPTTTRPLRLYDCGDNYLRIVPEEVDGSDPSKVVMDWMDMLASGIGVLKEVDPVARKGVLVGLTRMGDVQGWGRFDLRLKFGGVPTAPFEVHSLISFDAILERIDKDGIPCVRALDLVPLGQADSTLIAALAE
ncbi:hypothetical protein OC834_005671 [Tilletia horrida]|nr:hypothetical protein OC834_005671 [Tilletia horrida]